jgi:hypothetical protein
MSIEFSAERWERVKAANRLFWRGELDRPLIHITVGGRDPGRPEPRLKPGRWHFAEVYRSEVPADEIVDRWDYDLSCSHYRGDAFPSVYPNFGPGIIAAFLGAIFHPAPEEFTCWFHPPRDLPISDLHFMCDTEHVLFRRLCDLYRAGVDRWQGAVQLGMTDLGGNLDILSTFRPGEQLLFDLVDHPDEVTRLTWEAHQAWLQAYRGLDSVIRPVNPGYSTWAGIFSEEPHYMLQCDFCYMIGPAMFEEFVRPELAETCRLFPNSFYHLDGPGELPHLDHLLSIPDLKGIQWVPGCHRPQIEWVDLYRRIRKGGKFIQIMGDVNTLDTIVKGLGSGAGIWASVSVGSLEEAQDVLRRYGVE